MWLFLFAARGACTACSFKCISGALGVMAPAPGGPQLPGRSLRPHTRGRVRSVGSLVVGVLPAPLCDTVIRECSRKVRPPISPASTAACPAEWKCTLPLKRRSPHVVQATMRRDGSCNAHQSRQNKRREQVASHFARLKIAVGRKDYSLTATCSQVRNA